MVLIRRCAQTLDYLVSRSSKPRAKALTKSTPVCEQSVRYCIQFVLVAPRDTSSAFSACTSGVLPSTPLMVVEGSASQMPLSNTPTPLPLSPELQKNTTIKKKFQGIYCLRIDHIGRANSELLDRSPESYLARLGQVMIHSIYVSIYLCLQ